MSLFIIRPKATTRLRWILCLRKCKMTTTNKTFLLGGRPRQPWSGLCCIPYLLLLLMCVGCNHILFFLHVDNDLLAFVSFVSDFVQDRLWGPFVPLLDAATADALIKSDASDTSDRKLIRKSDSLATAVNIPQSGVDFRYIREGPCSGWVLTAPSYSFFSRFNERSRMDHLPPFCVRQF